MQERFFIQAPNLREAYFGSCHGDKFVSVSYSNVMALDLIYIMEHFITYEMEERENMLLRTVGHVSGMEVIYLHATKEMPEHAENAFSNLKTRIKSESLMRTTGKVRSTNFLIDDFVHIYFSWYNKPDKSVNNFLIMKDKNLFEIETKFDFENEERVIVIRDWPSRSERFGRTR